MLYECLLPLEHAVAVRALEVGRLVLQVVLPQLTRVPEALLTNLAEMLVREVDPVGVDGPGGPVGQDLVAVLALDLHRLVLVHEGDVLAQVAPRAEDLSALDALGVGGRGEPVLAEVLILSVIVININY